ncbi:GNAT family N-acetyltransferase [Heliorestis acidaminivorans]|uniref:GNAT family N-acetyltransferase n=1 Tax=Heliorestis acidaminivorans TaxID=553427 RepID=A0A6I0EWJ3_9FIRM|nr:GNAT family N-acetyltransferase [Heliorestis acidaminivorans]KAB2954159.1 GNAT family N-acetyltransferase [Heliorestis acidaminivorans]
MTIQLKTPRTPRVVNTQKGIVSVAGPYSPDKILHYQMDEGLCAFRPPQEQLEALAEIADLPQGQIILALHDNLIVGYVTFHPPEEFARWAKNQVPGMLEMGAIEVSRQWRSMGVSSALLDVAFGNCSMDTAIVIATEYYWHWDLKGKDMSIWEYQKFLESHFGRIGLKRIGTDEPDILAHPANMLMVRIGSKVPQETILTFEESLYLNRWFF